MIEVLVPRENVNDTSVIILEINFISGSKVKKGDVVVSIETSKTNIEVEAPDNGVVTHQLRKGAEIGVGTLLFSIFEEKDPKSKAQETIQDVRKMYSIENEKAKFSTAAIERAYSLNIALSQFSEGWITSTDIDLVANKNNLNISKREKLVILGGGGHSKMCIDILNITDEYEVVGVLDSLRDKGEIVSGVEVIGNNSSLEILFKKGIRRAINGVGSVLKPDVRKSLYEKLRQIGYKIPNLIHPSAVVEPSVILGEGNQIMMGACVGSDVRIVDNVIVNSGSIISHDSLLNSHSHIAPGAILAGGVTVGELSVVGMGAIIYMNVNVAAKCTIKNGEAIFKDVE